MLIIPVNSTNLLTAGVLDLPKVSPGDSAKVSLPNVIHKLKGQGKEVFLTISLSLRQPTAWADIGHEVAWFQHRISDQEPTLTYSMSKDGQTGLSVAEAGAYATVTGNGFSFIFDKTSGYLLDWKVDGISMVQPDPSTGAAIALSFWRPPTDNDAPNSLPYWKRFGVDALTSQLRSFEINSVEGLDGNAVITVVSEVAITPPVLDWGYHGRIWHGINPDGSLTISASLKPVGSHPEHVPRAGLNIRLSRRLDRVKWFGLGPGESYPDKQTAQRVGVWTADCVSDLQTPYDVPQENGNRMGTRWIKMTEPGTGRGLRAVRTPDQSQTSSHFNFVASRHSARMIENAKHPCDLVEEDATLLRLDAHVAGVGTGACGPGVREDLLVAVQNLDFAFVLEPVSS